MHLSRYNIPTVIMLKLNVTYELNVVDIRLVHSHTHESFDENKHEKNVTKVLH